jgi:hypothetical protein
MASLRRHTAGKRAGGALAPAGKPGHAWAVGHAQAERVQELTDLSHVLGGLLASVAKARHIADLETAAIAEQYRANPLLEGLSVPRVRLPEVCVELPLIIEAHAEASPSRLADPKLVAREVVSAVAAELTAAGVELPQDVRHRLANRLRTGLTKTATAAAQGSVSTESLARRAQAVTDEVLASSVLAEGLGPDVRRAVGDAARRAVDETAEAAPGHPPALQVNVVSGEVKERTAPASAARLCVTLREEGLEWDVARIDDGRIRRRLGPE